MNRFELALLQAIRDQPEKAYGAGLTELLVDHRGWGPLISRIYVALERFERRGLLTSEWGEATPLRGGRRKRYYKLTAAGETALQKEEK